MSFESDLATLRQQAEAWAGESTTRNLTTMHAALVKAAAANPQPPEPAGPPYTADDAAATATTLGLASCPLSQPLEIGATRRTLRDDVLSGTLCPQIVLRLGWPPVGPPPPATPRRSFVDIASGEEDR